MDFVISNAAFYCTRRFKYKKIYDVYLIIWQFIKYINFKRLVTWEK